MKLIIVSKKYVKKRLPIRTLFSNKTDGGKLLVVGGSVGMWGAGILAALAAARSGAGYTYLMAKWNNKQLLKHPDLLFLNFDLKSISNKNFNAYVFGPGIGINRDSRKLLNFFIKNKVNNLVLDADALTILAKNKNMKLPSTWILTPHEGELARLLNTTAKRVRRDPIKYLQAAQKKWGCHILLKGSRSYITDGKKTLVCTEGTPALAKAGTGDVLAGIIGALLAQGIGPLEAASVGAFVHGYSSQIWLKDKNDLISLRPMDIVEILPKAFRKLR